MSYISTFPWREKKSLNFNSLLNSTTCWDKEGGAVNQLNSLGRRIIVISFFEKDDNNKLYYFKVTHYQAPPRHPLWQLKLILKEEVVEILAEYNPDILNLNPLTKETTDPEKTELCW